MHIEMTGFSTFNFWKVAKFYNEYYKDDISNCWLEILMSALGLTAAEEIYQRIDTEKHFLTSKESVSKNLNPKKR